MLLLAVAACQGPPARLVAGFGDTVVMNSRKPLQLSRQVFDARGHALPDSGVHFEWTSGAPISVTGDGVVTCAHTTGDATVRASLGPVAKTILLRCRPVDLVYGGGELHLVVPDSSSVLAWAPVDSAGRPVELYTMRIEYDSTIVRLDGGRLRARASGQTSVDLYIGDGWAHWWVSVYEPASSVAGIQPGQGLAVPVRLAGGEMQSLELPPSPPTYYVTMLPDRGSLRTPRLAMLGANCNGGRTMSLSHYWCFAKPGAAAVAYHPKQEHPREEWSGTVAVWREVKY